MIASSIIETIGRTPIVRLRTWDLPAGSEVLVKLEGANPGGSIKDRAAWSILRAAMQSGHLLPGATIIESTSGNFGKALALLGAALGHPVVLVVDPKTPASVLRFAEAYGAQVVLVTTPDENGGYQVPRIAKLRQLLDETPGSFCPEQYDNPKNPDAHRLETSQEILDQAGRVDVIVAAVSTGGHLSGLAAGLRADNKDLVVIAVDAVGSRIFEGPAAQPYAMRGLGLAWCPGNLDTKAVDLVHHVGDHEAFAMSRAVARREGILLGESAGGVTYAALHYASRRPQCRVLAIAADSGVNYLGESWDDEWLRQRGLLHLVNDETTRLMAPRLGGSPAHPPSLPAYA